MEGHPVGHVGGFAFLPDPGTEGDERRLVGEQGAQLAGRERGEDRAAAGGQVSREAHTDIGDEVRPCLLYTSPSPRD